MKISMIAAMDRNRVIGSDRGGLPWELPRDAQRFREYAAGKHLLLGRRTFEEMRGWFTDGQVPIVLTHREDFDPGAPVIRTAHSVEEAVTEAFESGASELVVCGGESVYAAALPFADELVLTLVDAEGETGDAARFPDFQAAIEWETAAEERHPPDTANVHGVTFVTLRRVRPSSLRPGRLRVL